MERADVAMAASGNHSVTVRGAIATALTRERCSPPICANLSHNYHPNHALLFLQEDELLRQAVAKFGDRAWATVANDVPGRSSKSCSDRYH